MQLPKYPNITVGLIGNDGNAFSVLGQVSKALKRAKVDPAEIEQFQDEAISGDYNRLLQICMKWVEVE